MCASASVDGQVCGSVTCDQAATRQCPTCIQLSMKPTYFCSQECFKACWKVHNQLHKKARLEKQKQNFVPPSFDYTGPLRPHYVTPRRKMPDDIAQPDYAVTGYPTSEAQRRGDTKIDINTPEQIEIMRETCRIGREILDLAARAIRVGVTTEEIDVLVHEACIERGVYPSPLNYHGFPKACCTSVNEVICHGIPDARPLRDGDIVNIDITVFYKGHHGDLNETYFVGNVDERYKKLVRASHDSLMLAIQQVRPGALFRDFGNVISKFVKRKGFSVVKSYCGHGIGKLFHCAPNVPHYSNNKAVGICKPGMTFTIEPMISEGDWHDETWPDDWTAVTADGRRSAQFEHTLLVTEDGCEVLTQRLDSSPPLFLEDASTTVSGEDI